MKLTHDSLSALFNCNAPNLPQAGLLGIKYPLKRGWMNRLIGTEIPDDVYHLIKSLKGSRPRGFSKIKWRTMHRA